MAILSKFSNNETDLLAWEDSLPVPFRVLPVLSKVPSVGSLPNGCARDFSAGRCSRNFRLSRCQNLNSIGLASLVWQVVHRFRQGGFNTLVSTCVGEEGLDIGEVDLIVCFDAQKNPIRLVQRMGRTGRKRRGRIVVVLAEGREERVGVAALWKL